MRCMPAPQTNSNDPTITDLLFGSVTDVLDRYLPDKEKHGALRGMLSLLASTPPTAGPRRPDRRGAGLRVRRSGRERTAGQEAAGRHRGTHVAPCRRVHFERRRTAAAQQGRRDPRRRRPRHRRPPRGRLDADRAGRHLRGRAGSHGQRAGRLGRGAGRRPGAVLPRRPPRQLPADALRARWHPGVRGALRIAQRSRDAVEHRDFQHTGGAAAAVGGLPARHRACGPGHRAADAVRQRSGPGAARQARGVGVLAVVPDPEGRDGRERTQHRATAR